MVGQAGGSDGVTHIASDTSEADDPPPPSPPLAKGKGKERAAPARSLAMKPGQQSASISKVALHRNTPTRQQQLDAIVTASFPLPPDADR